MPSAGSEAERDPANRSFAACSWILEQYKGAPIRNFYLESNFATDKKASQINVMRTRGKRVVAEAVVKRRFKRGESIVDQGKKSNFLAILLTGRARVVTGDEKREWWARAVEVWPSYDDYQASTEREIPVVVLER